MGRGGSGPTLRPTMSAGITRLMRTYIVESISHISTGSTIVADGVAYEVLWNGEEGLTGIGERKPSEDWVAPPRIYNKSGKHSKRAKAEKLASRAGVDKGAGGQETADLSEVESIEPKITTFGDENE